MAEKSLTELIDTIDRLVAQYQTTNDPEVRTRSLVEGLEHACLAMKKLNRLVNDLADRVLSEYGFGEQHAAYSFGDVVSRDEKLAPFQTPQALRDFLAAAEPLLVGQLFVSPRKIKELYSAVRDTYEHFMDQRVGLSQMREQFERLERFFCRPPDEGRGGSPVLPPDGPDGRPSPARSTIVCGYLIAFAAISQLIIKVVEVFASAAGGLTAQLQTPEKRTVALLSVLLLTGFSDMLDRTEDIPEVVLIPGVGIPAGG